MKSLLEFHGIKKKASEVDFIVPFLDCDRPYFVDPTLLRFSDEERFEEWRRTIDVYIQLLSDYIKSDDREGLKKILDTGEAKVVGLGYASESIDGSGVGPKIADSIIKTLITSADFKQQGIERLEQLQFFDKGIASDRISDLAVHILKEHLVEYTQRQAKNLGIPVEPVHVGRIFDYVDHEWKEKKYNLPVNPLKTVRDALNPYQPILLVPKEIVRPLPIYLNYDAFVGFLRQEKIFGKDQKPSKKLVAAKARQDPELTSRYVRKREGGRNKKLTRHDLFTEKPELADRLEKMPVGHEYRDDFRDAVGSALPLLYPNEIEFYDKEVSTVRKSSRRDVIFRNIAGVGVFKDVKDNHGAHHIIVDAKNVKKLASKDIKQVAGYLNEKNGLVGIIVTPDEPTGANINAAKEIYLHEGKVVLIIGKNKLINSLRGQSRILASDGSPRYQYDPHNIISDSYSEIMTA